jgi:hypothetical protein
MMAASLSLAVILVAVFVESVVCCLNNLAKNYDFWWDQTAVVAWKFRRVKWSDGF